MIIQKVNNEKKYKISVIKHFLYFYEREFTEDFNEKLFHYIKPNVTKIMVTIRWDLFISQRA